VLVLSPISFWTNWRVVTKFGMHDTLLGDTPSVWFWFYAISDDNTAHFITGDMETQGPPLDKASLNVVWWKNVWEFAPFNNVTIFFLEPTHNFWSMTSVGVFSCRFNSEPLQQDLKLAIWRLCSMGGKMVNGHGAVDVLSIGRRNLSTRRKPHPSAPFLTTNPKWCDLGSHPGRRACNPATNGLSYVTGTIARCI
jgi:hypothetical protein